MSKGKLLTLTQGGVDDGEVGRVAERDGIHGRSSSRHVIILPVVAHKGGRAGEGRRRARGDIVVVVGSISISDTLDQVVGNNSRSIQLGKSGGSVRGSGSESIIALKKVYNVVDAKLVHACYTLTE